MHTFLFRCLLTGLLCFVFVQVTKAQWVVTGNTRSVSLGESIARDASGNVYGTGVFTCNLIIQGDTLYNPSCGDTTTAPLAIPRFDGYLVKFTPTGKLLWSKQIIIGNASNALFEVKGISVSSSSVFITGHYKGSLTFGSTVVTNTTAVSDAFVACYDMNGNFLWVKTNFARNAASEITAASVAAGSDGSAVLTGKYKGSVVSSNDADTIVSSTSALYLIKFNSAGTYQWLKSSQGKNTGSRAEGTDLWQDTNGNIFLTGNVTDTVSVQQVTIHLSSGTSGIFISKFNSTGKLQWLKKDSVAHANTIELEKDQKYFLLGGDYKNNNKLGGTALTTAANYGAYVARYDTSGAMQWVKTLTVAAADSAAVTYGVSGDVDGNIYAIGNFGKRTSSGAVLTTGSKNITAKPGVTFYVAKYKQDGTPQWLQLSAEGTRDSGNDIVAYDSSQVFITGYFNKVIRVDSVEIENTSVGLNSFVARIDDCPYVKATVQKPVNIVACRKDSILLQAVTAPGQLYQWQKNGVDISGAATANLYAKDSALYRVVVRSTNPALGCIKYSPGVFITINPLPDTAIHISGKLEFCEGASVTLNAAFGYKYKWIVNGAAPLAKDTLAGYVTAISGTYRVALVSNKGCLDSSRTFTTIAEPIPAPLITPASRFVICEKDTVFMSTAANATYKYQWYKNSIPLLNDTLSTYKAYTTGRFNVFVKNRLGCGKYALEDTVSVNSAPVASITHAGNLTACPYALPTLSTSANPSINTIEWFRNGITVTASSGNTYKTLESGTYHVKVTNAINCSSESSGLNVIVNPQPVATATLAGSNNFCANDSVRINGAAGAYTYIWQRNGTTISSAQSAAYYGKQAGTYRVIITDANACSDTSSTVSITAFSVPVSSIQAAGNLTFCTGDSVQLNATPGTGLAYEWFRDGTSLSATNNRTQTIKTNGDYAVRVYNTIGCADTSGTLRVHVYSIPPNTITPSGPLDFCAGNNLTLSAVEDPVFLYQWRKNNVAITSGGNNADYNVTSSGSYNVIISINDKCTSTSSLYAVNVKPLIKPVIKVDNEFISTSAFLSYQWYKNGTAITGATNQIYEVKDNGQYSIQVTDLSDCSVQADPVAVCVPVPHIQANGSVLNSTSGSFYQWYVNGVAISNATSQSYLVNTTGDYKIKVSRNDGCASFSNTIRVCIPPPVITAGINNVLTSSAGFSYQWFLNGTALPGIDTRIIVADQSGNYTVQVEDLSGCTSMSMPVSVVVLSITNGFKNAPARCYPNPFDGRIMVDIQNASLLPVEAAVYDMQGISVLETVINSTEESLPTDHLAPGSYVLVLTSASDRFYYKLIKTPK
jgi:hypothetical protein